MHVPIMVARSMDKLQPDGLMLEHGYHGSRIQRMRATEKKDHEPSTNATGTCTSPMTNPGPIPHAVAHSAPPSSTVTVDEKDAPFPSSLYACVNQGNFRQHTGILLGGF